MTLEEAVDALAACAVHARTELPTFQEKQAEGLSDMLSSLGTTFQGMRPELQHALMGGGLGALAGGGATMWNNSGKPDEERKSPLSGALTGALAGGALGGGLSLLHQNWPGRAGVAGEPAEPTGPPPTEFMHNGQRMRIPDEAFHKNPHLAEQIRAHQAPTTEGQIADMALSGAGTALWNAPFTLGTAAYRAGRSGLNAYRSGAIGNLLSGRTRLQEQGADLAAGLNTATGSSTEAFPLNDLPLLC